MFVSAKRIAPFYPVSADGSEGVLSEVDLSDVPALRVKIPDPKRKRMHKRSHTSPLPPPPAWSPRTEGVWLHDIQRQLSIESSEMLTPPAQPTSPRQHQRAHTLSFSPSVASARMPLHVHQKTQTPPVETSLLTSQKPHRLQLQTSQSPSGLRLRLKRPLKMKVKTWTAGDRGLNTKTIAVRDAETKDALARVFVCASSTLNDLFAQLVALDKAPFRESARECIVFIEPTSETIVGHSMWAHVRLDKFDNTVLFKVKNA
ncbi:MAG: hypothetical protein MHM6MM_005895 [Cercozoa sp. M6MM]